MKKQLLLLIPTMILVACGGTTESSVGSNESITSHESINSNESSIHSEESSPRKELEPYASFPDALAGNSYYNIKFDLGEGSDYVEINTPECYSYCMNQTGYIILDDDSTFQHFFSFYMDENFQTRWIMNGRVGLAKDLEDLRESSTTFYDVLNDAKYDFVQDPNDPWRFTYIGRKIGNPCRNFFQLHEFDFCNWFEITVDKYTGAFETFKAGEYTKSDLSDLFVTEHFRLEPGEIDTVKYYQTWNDEGRPIKERIIDYKTFYRSNALYKTAYTHGSLTATVTAKYYDGSILVAAKDDFTGPIGMKVVPGSGQYQPEVGDVIDIDGDIAMETGGVFGMSPYFKNAQLTFVKHTEGFPMFSEESIVDSYAPGIMAVQYFTQSPVFSGSIYDGYAYAGGIPEQANPNGDTVVTMYCPYYKYDATGLPFSTQLHMPVEYGIDNINAVLAELRTLGDYEVDDDCQLVFLHNVMVSFPFDRPLSSNLYAIPGSTISHRYSYLEMVEEDFGLTDFPAPPSSGQFGMFHFGPSSEYYLESTYAIEDENLAGVFCFSYSVTIGSIRQYCQDLINYGATLVDKVKIALTVFTEHHIFKLNNNIYIDLMYDEYRNDTSDTNMQMFIYRADEACRCESVKEKVDRLCGDFFKGDEFIILDGTYDKDYHVYTVQSFAGNSFSAEKPLTVVCLDILENRYEELRKAYRDAGWKQYRNADESVFAYNTRGVTRTIYYKENDHGTYTFIDFGAYPSSDYTFLNHDLFDPRIEMVIYEGTEPMVTQYTQDISQVVKDACDFLPEAAFNFVLPEQYKAELYLKHDRNYDYDFGYCFNSDALIYPVNKNELDECFQYVCDYILSQGWEVAFNGQRGTNFRKVKETETGVQTVYIYVGKFEEHGYVRMISGIGGADF